MGALPHTPCSSDHLQVPLLLVRQHPKVQGCALLLGTKPFVRTNCWFFRLSLLMKLFPSFKKNQEQGPCPWCGKLPDSLLPGPRRGGNSAWRQHGNWVASPSNSVSRRPLPQEDVTICCAGAYCQRDKIFMAALSSFPFPATVTYLLQIYMHV